MRLFEVIDLADMPGGMGHEGNALGMPAGGEAPALTFVRHVGVRRIVSNYVDPEIAGRSSPWLVFLRQGVLQSKLNGDLRSTGRVLARLTPARGNRACRIAPDGRDLPASGRQGPGEPVAQKKTGNR